MVRERRWIILAQDGRHVTLGCVTDPTDEEVAQASNALQAQGLGGWLAVLEGYYYQPWDKLTLMMVREIAPCSETSWTQAEAAFLSIRENATRAA